MLLQIEGITDDADQLFTVEMAGGNAEVRIRYLEPTAFWIMDISRNGKECNGIRLAAMKKLMTSRNMGLEVIVYGDRDPALYDDFSSGRMQLLLEVQDV